MQRPLFASEREHQSLEKLKTMTKVHDAKSRGLAVRLGCIAESEIYFPLTLCSKRWTRPIILSGWMFHVGQARMLMPAYGGSTSTTHLHDKRFSSKYKCFASFRPSNILPKMFISLHLMLTMMAFSSMVRNVTLNNLMPTPHSISRAIALLPPLNVSYIILGLDPPTLDQLLPPSQKFILCFSIFRTLSIFISNFLAVRLW